MELDAVSLCLIRLVNYLKRERFKKNEWKFAFSKFSEGYPVRRKIVQDSSLTPRPQALNYGKNMYTQ